MLDDIQVTITLPISLLLDSKRIESILTNTDMIEKLFLEEIENKKFDIIGMIVKQQTFQNTLNKVLQKYDEKYLTEIVNRDLDLMFSAMLKLMYEPIIEETITLLKSKSVSKDVEEVKPKETEKDIKNEDVLDESDTVGSEILIKDKK